MFERVFELLFKYRPVVFSQGELRFSPLWPAALALLIGLAAAAAVVVTYRAVRAPGGWRGRVALLGLRLATIGVLLFCLLRPVLVVRSVEPQQNFLAILVDDSRSMAIADRDGATRAAFVRQAFGPEASLRQALAARFTLRYFRFSSSTERVADPETLAFGGTRTDIGQALQRVTQELSGLPLSGVVLVSDGADNSQTALADALRAVRAASVPVFTVGVGREVLARDVQLGRVQLPTSVLKGSTLVVDAVVSQSGHAGQTVPLVVEDEGRVVGSENVVLPRDGEPATVRVRFAANDVGPRLLHFRIPVQAGEMVTQNNVRDAVVVVEDRREKILYVEGEPRYEMKFIRRAVAEDKNLQVVMLQRTAERKFLRLDIDDPQELAGGFPKTREELFGYRALVIGSIEASAFTRDQLRMMADFVSVRGGGVLALGGRKAFAEGGYLDTPVAEALPVVIEAPKPGVEFFAEVKVSPTRLGLAHAATQIAETEQASADRWPTLPPLTSVNPIRAVKPGAAVLLTGASQTSREPLVVLAYQRYGAGKALAFTVQDSWQWQMHADMSVEDLTHETLWRRLLRWLVDGVPDRVVATLSRDRVEPGERVTITATVRDKTYLDVNDAQVKAHVVQPGGAEVELPLSFVADRPGEYTASFTPDREGLYEVRVEATQGKEPAGSDVVYVRSAPGDSEYFDAAMRRPLLTRLAEETGGRFYTPETVAGLPEDVTYLGRGVTVVDEKDLWDMPAVLALLVSLLAAEWFLRRSRGLA